MAVFCEAFPGLKFVAALAPPTWAVNMFRGAEQKSSCPVSKRLIGQDAP